LKYILRSFQGARILDFSHSGGRGEIYGYLSSEQVSYIEKLNPSFKERHGESAGPGELLSQDTFYVGTLKGVGRV